MMMELLVFAERYIWTGDGSLWSWLMLRSSEGFGKFILNRPVVYIVR